MARLDAIASDFHERDGVVALGVRRRFIGVLSRGVDGRDRHVGHGGAGAICNGPNKRRSIGELRVDRAAATSQSEEKNNVAFNNDPAKHGVTGLSIGEETAFFTKRNPIGARPWYRVASTESQALS